MSVDVEQSLVGPALWKRVKPYKKKLNIVENPSVGTMTVPKKVCGLIGFALERMLRFVQERRADNVRIYCRIEQSNLVLGVTGDGSHETANYLPVTDISARLSEFPGSKVSFVDSHNQDKVGVELVVPLSA